MVADHDDAPFITACLGTKAQYIKTAPLLRLLTARELSYRLVDTGQHGAITGGLREELGVKVPDVSLGSTNVDSILGGLLWGGRWLAWITFRPGWVRQTLFAGRRGVCLVHGDTVSTLLATLAARRAGQRVALIEAGLRSHNLLRPFPEEIVRSICMKLGAYLFAPSADALDNMRRMRLAGLLVDLGQNTNVEALYYSLERVPSPRRDPYAVVTIHRLETITRRERLEHVVSLVERISDRLDVCFVMHPPTEKKLRQFDLLSRLSDCERVEVLPLLEHAGFVGLVAGAECVVTDGGSIQEETAYLDVPCLVMRTETERPEGLGDNVRLSGFDSGVDREFLEYYRRYRRGSRTASAKPSERMLEVILREERQVSERAG
mgnify:CR=1 FL=1